MLYDKLKKHDNPHESMQYLWNINLKKLAEYLQCDYKYLALILSGKKQAGKRLENDIWKLVNDLKKEKE